MFPRRMIVFPTLTLIVGLAVAIYLGVTSNIAVAQDEEPEFTTDFRLEDCKFHSKGENPYFFLKPKYQLKLVGVEENDEGELEEILLVITVLNETEDVGSVKTRVIEEREWVDGELVEVSRNFFVLCKPTNAVYYFGEDVDIFEDGEVVSHEGAWQAGKDGSRAGLIMPGTFLLGARYFQEVAPDVAMDRAEHTEMGLNVATPAGNFAGCVELSETTPLVPDEESIKRYCPGVGLVFDNGLELVDFGVGIFDVNDTDDSE